MIALLSFKQRQQNAICNIAKYIYGMHFEIIINCINK